MEKISWSRARFALKPHDSRFFRVQIFRGSPLDHENHENITPRKIPAIRYMASRSPSAGEPRARYGHAAVGVGQKLYAWGGDGGTSVQASTVECLDVPSATWQEPRQLRGHSLPDRLYAMAVTADGERAYSFGGSTDSGHSNRVYGVNMTSLECRELAPASASPAPSKKTGSGMVHYQHMLVVYGGYTSVLHPTDELHVFDLNTSETNGYMCVVMWWWEGRDDWVQALEECL